MLFRRPVLEFIKREIYESFGDPRYPFDSPSKNELFFDFAGDDPTELAQGTAVTVQIDAERPRLLFSMTSNGFDVEVSSFLLLTGCGELITLTDCRC